MLGLGEGLPGQLYVAIAVDAVPGFSVRAICCGGGVNEALTAAEVVRFTMHEDVPVQAPPQAANVLGLEEVAVKDTWVLAV